VEEKRMAMKWYILHVYSGFEARVKVNLEERIAASPFREKFGEVVVPTEQVVELVKGKRKTSNRKFYPGYILICMELDEESWHLVNSTAKVTGFLGERDRPVAISDEEAQYILNRMVPLPKSHFFYIDLKKFHLNNQYPVLFLDF